METAFTQRLTANRYPEWARLIRGASLTVAGNHSDLIGGVSVSQRFDGASESDREALVRLARDLAAEYSLAAEIEDNGRSISVRLTQSQAQAAEPGNGQGTAAFEGAATAGPSAATIRAVWQRFATTRRD